MIDNNERKPYEQRQLRIPKFQCNKNMGRCYLYGIGVSADRAEAIRLFKQAARTGDQKSIDTLNELGERY